ncbi:hypothetical protein D9M68_514930 [compost metagenome]
MLGQCFVDGLVDFLLAAGRQVDELLGAAVHLTALVIHDALAQGLVGRGLVGRDQRGVDLEAARVGAVAVLGVHQLAHGFRHVLGVQAVRVGGVAQVQLFLLGLGRLLGGDEAGLVHAVDHVELARPRAARVGHRVVGAGRLRQAGQHGGLGDGHLLQRLAEVGLGGGGEAVGAVAQVDLVQVDLQDLVLAQLLLEPEGQHDLRGLAAERALRAQVDVARHLHRDGRGALLAPALEAGHGRAREALVVHAAVVVEARVFHGQHGVLHDLRNVGEGREVAALLAELADQRTLGRVHAQRQLGPVVGQLGNVGQLRVDGDHPHDGGAQQRDGAGTGRDGAPAGDAFPRELAQRTGGLGRARFLGHGMG